MALGPDFCMVQLTTDGANFANGHPLGVHDGRFSFNFHPSTPVKAARYEWDMFLSQQVTPHGKPLFELVPDSVSVVAAASVPASKETP